MGDNYQKEQNESIPSFINNSINETHLEQFCLTAQNLKLFGQK